MGWQNILSKMNQKLSYPISFRILATSVLGKYVPGGIWYSASRIYQANRYGIDKSATLASIALETQFTLLGAVFFYLLLLATPSAQSITGLSVPLWLILLLTVFLLYPHWTEFAMKLAFKILKRDLVFARLKYLDFLKLLSIYIASWGLQGLGFFFLVSSIAGLNTNIGFFLVASYLASWVIGFLVLFAPGGIGVREGALTFLLKFYFPLPVAIMFSFLSRIWITVAELILAGAAIMIKKR
jgi:uncharacterized membrane protein YbhN (UPF0104 family)